MNDEIKNVMTIVTIARIVESTLWYCLPPRNGEFSVPERAARYQALTALTSEGSPFAINADNNGEVGQTLKEEMQYFIEDVYGDNGRIVSVGLDNHIRVEQSLIGELFSNIVKLRAILEGFLGSALRTLDERGTNEDEFRELVLLDIKYYHSFAGKISCILISEKFQELNQNANTYAQSYSKAHNGINPQNDPEFNVRNDPSFRMIENEFHQLNQDMVSVLNSYNDDVDFNFARQSVYADCEIFTGKKQTTDINAYFRVFTSYFDKLIDSTQGRLNGLFQNFGQKLQAEQQAQQAAAPAEQKEGE